MSRKIGVLFDMDGVIVDSYSFHKKALKIFIANHGFDISEDAIMNRYFGRQNREWIPDLFNKQLSAEEVEALAAEKEKIFRDLFSPEIKPVAGLLSFLQELQKAKVPMAVCTSAPPENVTFVLQKTNTHSFFQVSLNDKSVKNGKPDPEIYLEAAKALNLSATDCIVIEDSSSGIEAGKRAGAKVIGMATTHAREELPPTDEVADDFLGLNYQKLIDLFDKK